MSRNKKMKKITKFVPIPSTWEFEYTPDPLVELDEDCGEYRNVENKVQLDDISVIYRVENVHMYGRYLLKKKFYELNGGYKERMLLHATYPENAWDIALNNLDYRLVKRCKYGKGVSFTPKSNYANKEGCHDYDCEKRAMIVAKVLIGDTTTGKYGLKIPPSPFDTTIQGKSVKNTNVFVKYYDDEFYPEYIVFYDYYD